MNPFLQTLGTLLKFVGKVGFLMLMAVKNFVFVCVEVLVILVPTREVRSEKTEKS